MANNKKTTAAKTADEEVKTTETEELTPEQEEELQKEVDAAKKDADKEGADVTDEGWLISWVRKNPIKSALIGILLCVGVGYTIRLIQDKISERRNRSVEDGGSSTTRTALDAALDGSQKANREQYNNLNYNKSRGGVDASRGL